MDLEKATVATEGQQWVKDLPECDDLEVLVAPWENRAFNRELQKQVQKLPPAMRPGGVAEPNEYYRCVGIAIAKTILFDWRNLKLGGVEKPFDRAWALQMLPDQQYRPLRDGIVDAAKRLQLRIKSDDEAIEGNSKTSSPGSGTGEATPTA